MDARTARALDDATGPGASVPLYVDRTVLNEYTGPQAFTIVSGPAASLPCANIDTDLIMPEQFLKGIDREGLGDAAKNGLLPIALDPACVAGLSARAADPAANRMTIDLPAQEITTRDGAVHPFDIPARRKDHLVRGLDAIGATLDHADAIQAFQARHVAAPARLSGSFGAAAGLSTPA